MCTLCMSYASRVRIIFHSESHLAFYELAPFSLSFLLDSLITPSINTLNGHGNLAHVGYTLTFTVNLSLFLPIHTHTYFSHLMQLIFPYSKLLFAPYKASLYIQAIHIHFSGSMYCMPHCNFSLYLWNSLLYLEESVVSLGTLLFKIMQFFVST